MEWQHNSICDIIVDASAKELSLPLLVTSSKTGAILHPKHSAYEDSALAIPTHTVWKRKVQWDTRAVATPISLCLVPLVHGATAAE